MKKKILRFCCIFLALFITARCFCSPALAAIDQVFYNQNNITHYIPTCKSGGSTAPGSCPKLAEIRKEMTKNISEADKVLIYKSYLTETSVNPDSDAGKAKAMAHMEEVLNRAASRMHGDLAAELKYVTNYPPGYYQAFCSTSASWKDCDGRVVKYRAELDEIFDQVINGSNITHGATDNASAGVAYGSRASIICGMGGDDTECKTDDYGIQNKFAGGQGDVVNGVEYFFNNNSTAEFNQLIADNCSGSSSSSLSSSTNGSSAQNVDGKRVLWIGDSLSVGALDQIKATIPGVNTDGATDQIKSSKQFAGTVSGNPTGMELLDTLASSGQLDGDNPNNKIGYVVYALGTNDTGLTQDQVKAAIDKVGTGRYIVLVTNYYEGDDNHFKNNNDNIKAAASGNPNVIVADFETAAKSNKIKMSSDHIHLGDADANEVFVNTIVDAIAGKSSDKNICKDSDSMIVDGYTFPIQGATQENVNGNPGLTQLPCGPGTEYSQCHGGRGAEGGAMDLGIAPGNDTVGAKIVAPHDGKIYYTSNRHGYSDCHDIGFQATQNGKPIAIFGMLHNGEIMVTQGQEVKVGEVIGLMGPNKCADDSTPHLHFDKSTSATVDNTGDYDNGRDPDLAKLINKLYENLPKV